MENNLGIWSDKLTDSDKLLIIHHVLALTVASPLAVSTNNVLKFERPELPLLKKQARAAILELVKIGYDFKSDSSYINELNQMEPKKLIETLYALIDKFVVSYLKHFPDDTDGINLIKLHKDKVENARSLNFKPVEKLRVGVEFVKNSLSILNVQHQKSQ